MLFVETLLTENARFTTISLKLVSLQEIVVFLGLTDINSDLSYMFSCTRNAQVTFVEN